MPGQTFEDWAETLEAVTTAGREGGRGEGSKYFDAFIMLRLEKKRDGLGDRLDAEMKRRGYLQAKSFAIETWRRKVFDSMRCQFCQARNDVGIMFIESWEYADRPGDSIWRFGSVSKVN